MKAKYLLVILCVLGSSLWAATINVGLQNAAATFNQSGFNVVSSIDGVFSTDGWAISNNIVNQTAVYETQSDFSGSSLRIEMHQLHGGAHLLGRFRWSVTSDNRNGFGTGQGVNANWTVLTGASAVASSTGTDFTELADNSLLVSGTSPATGVYTVTYNNVALSNITGLRLEVMEHSSFPSSGPGRASNGNFVVSELVVTAEEVAVPEPGSYLLLLFALVCLPIARKA